MHQDLEFPLHGRLDLPASGAPQLWYARLAGQGEESRKSAVLSQDEWKRASRFQDPTSRARFVSARTILRRLLGTYLDLPAGEVPLEIGPEGKPKLGEGLGDRITFNLSHSGDWILLGFSGGSSIGVDIETESVFPGILEIASRVLATDEVAMLRELPPEARSAPFFRGWTRKEAFQKARGVGIWNQPTQFAAGLGEPSNGPGITSVHVPGLPHVWSVQGVESPTGYFAAVAMEGEILRVETFWLSAGD